MTTYRQAARDSLIALGVAGVIVAMSACGTAAPEQTPNQKFFSLLEDHPEVTANDDTKSSSLELAHTVCEVLDEGLTYDDVIHALYMQPDTRYAEIQVDIIDAGIEAFCPEYMAYV